MDILNELHSITKLRGDTYSSAEVISMIGRAANEIERLQGKVAYWQNLSLQAADIDRLQAKLSASLIVVNFARASVRQGAWSGVCDEDVMLERSVQQFDRSFPQSK